MSKLLYTGETLYVRKLIVRLCAKVPVRTFHFGIVVFKQMMDCVRQMFSIIDGEYGPNSTEM